VPTPHRYAVASVAVIAAVAVGTASTHGFLARTISVEQAGHVGDPEIVDWLSHQPQWAHGHLPIAVGPVDDMLYAGPTFSHQLSVIGLNTSCAQVDADADQGWVILPRQSIRSSSTLGEIAYTESRCLSNRKPLTVIHGLAIYLRADSD
jgi:hypothetical protein